MAEPHEVTLWKADCPHHSSEILLPSAGNYEHSNGLRGHREASSNQVGFIVIVTIYTVYSESKQCFTMDQVLNLWYIKRDIWDRLQATLLST